ncbi:hypothetical protein V8C44DRAFT_117788 [Trichoderma aethiopicum]
MKKDRDEAKEFIISYSECASTLLLLDASSHLATYLVLSTCRPRCSRTRSPVLCTSAGCMASTPALHQSSVLVQPRSQHQPPHYLNVRQRNRQPRN